MEEIDKKIELIVFISEEEFSKLEKKLKASKRKKDSKNKRKQAQKEWDKYRAEMFNKCFGC